MTLIAKTYAPAKVNASLIVGPTRDSDGRHELVSVMQSLDLADEVSFHRDDSLSADEVICPGVSGENLALTALRLFRERSGWDQPPVRVQITKRIPIAGGMAGGSADAGATLRIAAALANFSDDSQLHEIAIELGADVAHQLKPGLALAESAGEKLTHFEGALPGALVVVPLSAELSAGSVYKQADELAQPRSMEELAQWRERLSSALANPGFTLPQELMLNDLQAAAVTLCPPIQPILEQLDELGAQPAMVSGSGPTCVGWFADEDAAHKATVELGLRGIDSAISAPLTKTLTIELGLSRRATASRRYPPLLAARADRSSRTTCVPDSPQRSRISQELVGRCRRHNHAGRCSIRLWDR